MKRPSFQFYPGDWQANSNLRRCTHAEKGVWLDVMCLMHDQPEYGQLRWTLKEIAQAVGAPISALRGLINKGVLKGDDKDITEALTYTPRSGRKDGETVTLIPIQAGPLWYSSRMVRDEYVRTIRGESSRFGGVNNDSPKDDTKASPKPPFGDGSSSSSSSSSSTSVNTSPSLRSGDVDETEVSPLLDAPPPPEPAATAAAVRPAGDNCPHQQIIDAYHEALPMCPRIREWTPARAQALRSRWRERPERQNVDWWRRLFAYCAESDFLTGRAKPGNARRPFEMTLDWLVKAENFAKVLEGRYENSSDQREAA